MQVSGPAKGSSEAVLAAAQVGVIIEQAEKVANEITAEALVWLTRLTWAVEDCREFKMRQLMENYDEDVAQSIPPFLGLLRALTAEINEAIAYFRMHPHISRSLVLHATTIGSSIRASFYHI